MSCRDLTPDSVPPSLFLTFGKMRLLRLKHSANEFPLISGGVVDSDPDIRSLAAKEKAVAKKKSCSQ